MWPCKVHGFFMYQLDDTGGRGLIDIKDDHFILYLATRHGVFNTKVHSLTLFYPHFNRELYIYIYTNCFTPVGMFGTQDFLNGEEPRFQIAQGYPTGDYISAGLHADDDQTSDLHDYIAEVEENRWYLATLTYDGFHKEPTSPGDTPYFQSTVLYLNSDKVQGNSRVNIGMPIV